MIITKAKLRPFGCHADREFYFKPGLNVIVGPNEAGKSTLFHAIQKALLLQTSLNKIPFRDEMARHIPLGGGDSAQIELLFEHDGKAYHLSKTWGGGKAAKLTLPDGSVIADDAKVTECMENLLPATSGTIRSVLMTYQSGLEKTLVDLEEEQDTLQNLGDLLRKTLLDTGGISLEKFLAKLAAQEQEYFSRWDRTRKYPEGNKGIENPWKRDVGKILSAFYQMEKARKEYEIAAAYETDLDRLNRRISELTANIAGHSAFYEKYRKIIEDIDKRRALNAEAEVVCGRMNAMKQANIAWPALETEIGALEQALPGLLERVAALTREKEAADRAEKNKALQQQYERAKERKVHLEEAEKQLAAVPKLERAQLDQIKQAQTRLATISASLNAGAISVTFRPKQDMQVMVQKDLELMQETGLSGGKAYQVKAGGRIAVEYAGLELIITSGEGSFEDTKKKHDQAVEDLAGLLKQCGITSVEQAQANNVEYEAKLGSVKSARLMLEAEIKSTSFEELEAQVKEAGTATAGRSLSQVLPELLQARNEVSQKERDLVDRKKKLIEFQVAYKTHENLLDQLMNEKQKEQRIRQEMDALAPLPPEVTDLEAFKNKYDDNLSVLSDEEEKLKELKLEQAGKEGGAPEDTSEDLRKILDESEKVFHAAVRKGEAIARIHAAAQQIKSSAGGDVYQELGKDLESMASIITDKKYKAVKMTECMPEEFMREDGSVVFYDILSHGTKDLVGLILRLAIAKHFLKGSQGFLAMDDPLVNMDPKRQKKAAEVIKGYAAHKQVMIFTCHPGNAEMLGGNLIQL